MGLLDSAVGGALGIGTSLLGPVMGGIGEVLGGPAPQQAPPFTPFNVSGPFGQTTFRDGQLNLQLSPEMQQLQQSFMGQLRGGQTALTPAQMQMAQMGNLFGQQAVSTGQRGAGVGLTSGLFRQGLGRQAAGIGGRFLGAANQVDPQQIASMQLGRMQDLLAPSRQRQRLGTESRLLRQGLLGSTAAGERFRGLEEGFGQQDAQLAADALRQGMGVQGQLFGQGMQGLTGGGNLFGAGTQDILGGMRFGLGGMQQGLGFMGTGVDQEQMARQNFFNNLSAMQGLSSGLFNQANLGMAGGQNQAVINQANTAAQNAHAQAQHQATMGLLLGGAQMMMGMPPTAAAGSIAPTMGGTTGAGIGGTF